MKSPHRVWLTVGPLALAAGGGALLAVLTSDHEENRILVSIFGLLVGWSFLVAGLIARTRRPENRTGLLMLVVGFTFFLGALGAANNAVLYTIGIALGAVFIAALVHLLLAYPSGRLESQRERALVVAGYAAAFLANFVPMFVDPYPAAEDCAECPENKLMITDSPTADNVLTAIFNGLGFVVLALAIAVLVRRWRRASPAARRLLGPVLIAGATTLLFFALTIVVFPLSETAANVIGVGFVAGFVATPFVFLWGILRTRLTRLDVSALLADSAETPTLVETQEALRDALRDPTAELVYGLDDPPGYAKIDGERVRLDKLAENRAVMRIDADDEPLAAVIHDPALLDEPELLTRVAMALRLRLEKDRSVRALRISEYRSRALLDAIPDTMFRVARDGTVLDIHSHDPENVVIPPDEMIGTSLYDIPPEVIAREVLEERKVLVERAFETGEAQTQEYEIHMPSGRRRFAETRIVPSGENEFVMIVRDVTSERVTESRSRALLEALPDAMFRLARDGRFLDFHTPHPEVLAIPADEILEKTIYDVPPERIDRDVIEERVALAERAFETGEVQFQEYEIRRPDGDTMFSEARIVPAGEDEWVMIVRDVTDKRVMESRNEALLQALPDSVFRLTRDGIYLDFRARNAEHYLVETDSFVGTSIRDALPPDVAEGVMSAAERAFETGEMQTVEGHMQHEGEDVYAEARIVPSGENEFVMIVRDVTDQITQQRQIETQHEFLGAMGDATTGLLCNLHLDGRIGYDSVNLPMRELCGYEQYEVDGRYFWEVFVAPADRAGAERVIQDVAAGGDPGEQQSRWLTKDGRELIVAWTCRPMPVVTGKEANLLVSGSDVTERVRHEERIQRERDYFGALFDATPSFICVVDHEGSMTSHSLNRSMIELTGYSDEDVAGRPFAEIFSAPENATWVRTTIAAAAAGEDPGEQETHWQTRDGRKVLVAWTCTPLPEREAARRFVISGVDITERKLREEEQAALRRVAVAVAGESRPEEIFQTVTEEVGRLLGADAASMVRFLPEGNEGLIVGYWQRGEAIQDDTAIGRMITLSGGGRSQLAKSGHLIRYEDEKLPADWRERLRASGASSALTVPVLVTGRVWGTVMAMLKEGSLGPDAERRVAQFTNLVATALANAEAREQLLASLEERKQREDEQAALRRVAVAVASERRPDQVFQVVAEEVGRLFGGHNTHLVRFEGEREAVVLGGWVRGEIDADIIGRRIGLYGEGPISKVREAGHAIRLHPGSVDAREKERMEAEGLASILAAPVHVSGRLWGAVATGAMEGVFPPDAEERIAQFASLVATAIANAEARDELLTALRVRKQREDEQAALRRVAVAIASEHRPEDVFKTVTEEVGRVLGANRSHMLRYDPETEDAQIVGVWQDDEAEQNLLGRRIAVDQGPYRTIRELGRPIRYEVDNADVPPVLRARLEAEGVTSVVVAPIMVSGDLWGAVSISVTEGSLAAETEELVGPFTSLVATALANAEARAELLASRARIVEAGDAERRRLERNLHDGAQQRLVSLSLSLRLAQARLKSDVHAADEILSGASVELALALEELRELARGIHPAVLTDRGLGPALESLADRTPLPIAFDQLPEDRLPAPIEAAAFYVVSEALANVAKYADASSVTVRVAQENGYAIVEVADDGIGGADPESGSGLRGLSDRVAALEGRLAIVSPPGAGTRIRAEIPFG